MANPSQYERASAWVAGAVARARKTGQPQQSKDWGGYRRRCVTIFVEDGELCASLLCEDHPERIVRGSMLFDEAVDCLAGAG